MTVYLVTWCLESVVVTPGTWRPNVGLVEARTKQPFNRGSVLTGCDSSIMVNATQSLTWSSAIQSYASVILDPGSRFV